MRAKEFFTHLHDIEVNQKYAETLPYSFHLEMVYNQCTRFKHLLDPTQKKKEWFEKVPLDIEISIWGHDSIEDARLSYNDILNRFGEKVAEIIYLCTENKGRTRDERKPKEFYLELAQNKDAVFVKLCDIIANSLFSLSQNSSMFKKYASEYKDKVRPYLYTEQYKEMFDFLEAIYKL